MLGQRLLIPKASQSAKVYTGSLFEPDYLQVRYEQFVKKIVDYKFNFL